MSYDFETIVRGGAGNLKQQWTSDTIRNAGLVSFEAAEMDFTTAPSIKKSLTELITNGNFGFNLPSSEYKDAVCWWMKHVRDWSIDPDWIVPVMGTIYSVATTIRMVLQPGERIIVPVPGYSRYAQAAARLGFETVVSAMKENNGQYEMDFEDLERCMADPANRILILCNPHNPTGRVWSREELTKVAELSVKYDVIVYSDEIFAEVVFDGNRTIPYCEIEEGRSHAIVCTSLGKTFNFTGVNHANIIIPDEQLRERFTTQRTADHYGSLEPFAYASILGAYCEEGADWKQQMLQVIDRNRKLITDYFSEPDAPGYVYPVEGTFVCWIKWNLPGLSGETLKKFLDEEAMVPLEIGTEFGPGYENYTRMNLGSTTKQTEMAVGRLREAVRKYRNERMISC